MKELLNTGVNLPLDYDADTDALIGQINGYSLAVKENLATASYGCLFWAKEGGSTAATTADACLRKSQEANPEFIKKFMVSETGIAVALNRTNDDFSNVNHLKRFIYDFTSSLSFNYYKNCCCECGRTDSLALYAAEGTIAQACSACGAKYKFLKSVECEEAKESALEEVTVSEQKEESYFTALEIEVPKMPVVEEFPASVSSEESKTDSFEELLTPIDEPKAADVLVTAEKEDPVDDGLSELMFTEIKQEPVTETQVEKKPVENTAENFDSLLFTATEEKKNEPVKSALFEKIEREYAEEQAKLAAQTAQESAESSVSYLLIDESGGFALKEIEQEVDDGSSDVTEFHDDSDEGEDIEVDEIESTVNAPTVTTGHPQLTAEETPLEEDGSIPLINPNSHREERHVSAVDGPDAVQPLELAASITHEDLGELPDIQLPPGYATGENMERDVPDSMYPPPYTPTYDYSSYDKIKFRSSSNAFIGIIGILVFGFVGVAVWVAIAVLTGGMSHWGSIAVAISVFAGYRIAGKAMDKKGIVISFIMSIIMTIIGVMAVTTADLTQNLSEMYFTEATIKDAVNWLMNIIVNGEGRDTFLINIGISTVITLVADVIAAVLSRNKV